MKAFKMRGTDLFDSHNHRVAVVRRNDVFNEHNHRIAVVRGMEIFDEHNHRVSVIRGSDIFDEHNHKIGRLDDARREIDGVPVGPIAVALWYLFAR